VRLPLRTALAVVLSVVIVFFLALFVPPLVAGKEYYAKGHGRGEAIAAAERFAAEAAEGGDLESLVGSYADAYPSMDFELLTSDLVVLAASSPGPPRYDIARIAARLESEFDRDEDSQSFLKKLPGSGPAAFLLLRLRSPFYISFSRQAVIFLSRSLVVVFLLALLVFGLALAAFSLPFARRVSRLARAISSYAPGAPMGRLALAARKRDETGEIAVAFTEMASRLADAERGRRDEESARRAEEAEWRVSVANLSHDLRTPLSSVLGYSEILVSGAYSGDEERRRYEGIIHAKSVYMTGLLDSLLEYARLGNPGPEEEAEGFDLCELARSVVIEYLDEAERRGLAVDAAIPGDAILVRARLGALSRAVRNLLDNAIKYGYGGGRLEVRLSLESSQSRLEIRDFGPGIPEAERERVFERHYRVDPAVGSLSGGLGLPIARAIARREGGDVFLESPADGGCRFVLLLPYIR